MTPVEISQGVGPIVLGCPHTGTYVPDEVFENLNPRGRGLADTDWHIHTLYENLLPDVTTVRATFHRYVIDANRDPSGALLYPRQNTTALVPLTDFDGHDIWTTPPDADAIETRRMTFHAPYHASLRAELDRVHAQHGFAILYDCHSIRSHIPFLFEGTLPDFNIGTNGGTTCHARVRSTVESCCQKADGYSSVSDGRFKGGWTTRHYGEPEKGYHAVQMELAQSTYLTEETAPWTYDKVKAANLRTHLAEILNSLAKLNPRYGDKP